MTPFFGISSLLDSTTMESLALWLARATVIAAMACAFLALARRVRPATRCVIAVASVCAIVMLPVASALLPVLSVPVLPAEPADVPEPGRAPSVPFAIDTPATVASPVTASNVASPVIGSTAAYPARVSSEPSETVVPTPAPARKSFMTSIGRALSTLVVDAARSIGWSGFALLSWVTVSACLLSWIAIGAIGARRLARRSTPITDEYLLVEYERACRILGIRRPVALGISGDIAIPIVVGTFHPRVVLPFAAAAWSRERLATVLLHELAHVRRRDGLWMMVVRTARALVWFHPLMWMLATHARRDAERACDELVLASGVRGSDYAEHLIAIARSAMARDPYAGTALALATRSSLEARVVAILSTRVPRGGISRRAAVTAIAASFALFVTVAATRPTQVESAQVLRAATVDLVELAPTSMNIEPKCTDAVVEEGTPAAAAAAVAPVAPVAPIAEPFVYAPETPIAVKPVIKIKPYMIDKAAMKAARKAARAPRAQNYYYMTDKDGNRSGGEWYARANELYNSKRYARAGEAYENAAREGYRADVAFYNAGCSYALADQTGRAIDMLREAVDEGFDDPEKYAEDSDLNSLRGDPRFKDLMNDLMESGTAQSEHKEAKREYDRMAKSKDIEEGEWNSVGIDLLRSGDYETAAQAFQKEYDLTKDEDALYNKACARSLAGKEDDALKLLEQAITTGSVDAGHMKNDPDLVALHDQKKFKDLYVLADDLTLQGGEWWGNFDWGRDDDDDGSKAWKRSVSHYQDVAQEHPKIGRAWFNLGFVQLASDDAKSSIGSFQKALDLGYKTPTTMYNLACANSEAGNVDAAISWLEKSEGAGFEVWNSAKHDDDLDNIRDDPRFKKMAKRWREIEREKRDGDWDYKNDDDDKDT